MFNWISVGFIAASLPFIFARLIKGPYFSDRLLALDILSISLSAGILLLMHESGWGWDRDTVWIIVGISFMTTFSLSLWWSRIKDE